MTEKRKLLNQLQMYNFAVIETGLFLDTHPFNKKALAYLGGKIWYNKGYNKIVLGVTI